MTPLVAITGALLVIVVLAIAGRSLRNTRIALAEVRSGRPRRGRALLRLIARDRGRSNASWFYEATALFWQGHFERALGSIEDASLPALVLEIECLILTGRIEDARRRFDPYAKAILAYAPGGYPEGVVVAALLCFHEGDLPTARAALAPLVREHLDDWSPVSRIARFYAAAIDRREGRIAAARAHLDVILAGGGDSFIVLWAAEAYEQCFGVRPIIQRASTRRVPRFVASIARSVSRGLMLLSFRSTSLEGTFSYGDVALVLTFDLLLTVALQMAYYTRGALFLGHWAGQIITPALVLAPATYFVAAALGVRRLALPLCGHVYAALPLLVLVQFGANDLRNAHPFFAGALVLASATWLAAAVLFVLIRRAPNASPVRRILAAMLACGAWFLPVHALGSGRLWVVMPSLPERTVDDVDVGAFTFDQADKIQSAERLLAPERPGVADLYFIGFAPHHQDVFRHEVLYAQSLFEDRFDTRGHSLVMANDLSTRDSLPMALRPSLAHVLRFVGSAMNRDEDVLFLFLTSHGSRSGLGIRAFHAPEELGDDQLTPAELRADLDSAGIKWRVIVVSGCMTGGFVPALANDQTIVATASAEDRASFGCKTGNEFTAYGRALFAQALRHECSFSRALTKANALIDEREKSTDETPSMPQISVGAAIESKLRDLPCRGE